MINFIDLFSGMGSIAYTARSLGFSPLSIEKDPSNFGYSLMMHSHHQKLGLPSRLATVEDFSQDPSEFAGKIKIVHGSPSCRHYTQATRGNVDRPMEDAGDLSAAIAYNKVIRTIKPDTFTLEQVPGYRHSHAFALALEKLDLDYDIQVNILDLSDYGLPQHRKRLFIMGWKRSLSPLRLPPKSPTKNSWFDTLEGIECKQATLPKACEGWNETRLLRPNKSISLKNSLSHGEIFPTILRSHFCDQKGDYRSTTFKYVQNGKCYIIPLRAIARAQGFPDDFPLPSLNVIAGQGIGNAFPPMFYGQFLKTNFSSQLTP